VQLRCHGSRAGNSRVRGDLAGLRVSGGPGFKLGRSWGLGGCVQTTNWSCGIMRLGMVGVAAGGGPGIKR